MATTLEEYGTGLGVNAISIEDAAPPVEVAERLRRSAESRAGRKTVSSKSPTSIPTSSSVQPAVEAAQIREEAAGLQGPRSLQEANGEAQRFQSWSMTNTPRLPT